MCGHNEKLKVKLQEMKSSAPRAYVGFTQDVMGYMKAAKFFIGKPGPGSISEAILAKLPIITFKNAFTLPQELYNCDWVTENGLGVVVNSIKEIPDGVSVVTNHYDSFHHHVSQIDNQAVFEIPDILQSIVA
jgi:UDP-N-acetylglucosamine:LPS N-acetylglucosamine transferase